MGPCQPHVRFYNFAHENRVVSRSRLSTYTHSTHARMLSKSDMLLANPPKSNTPATRRSEEALQHSTTSHCPFSYRCGSFTCSVQFVLYNRAGFVKQEARPKAQHLSGNPPLSLKEHLMPVYTVPLGMTTTAASLFPPQESRPRRARHYGYSH